MLRRIHSDAEVAYARVAAIKPCLVRNSRLRGNPLEVSVKLDPSETNAGYNCGRLFALLETAQTDSADRELDSTIKDRYFSSASTTPALVFPRLFRLSQQHLAKLETGYMISYDRRLGEVMGLLDRFPRQLALEDQGRFVIGYFHQRQDTRSFWFSCVLCAAARLGVADALGNEVHSVDHLAEICDADLRSPAFGICRPPSQAQWLLPSRLRPSRL